MSCGRQHRAADLSLSQVVEELRNIEVGDRRRKVPRGRPGVVDRIRVGSVRKQLCDEFTSAARVERCGPQRGVAVHVPNGRGCAGSKQRSRNVESVLLRREVQRSEAMAILSVDVGALPHESLNSTQLALKRGVVERRTAFAVSG